MTLAAPITFAALVARLKQAPIEELRKEFEGYFEFVILTQNLVKIYPDLETYFGVPFKPAGVEPSAKHGDVAKRYGGIRRQQTLYFVKANGISSCGLIWPWGDGQRSTVKLAQGEVGEPA